MKEFSEYHIEKYIQGLLSPEEAKEFEAELKLQPKLNQKVIALKNQTPNVSFAAFKEAHIKSSKKEGLKSVDAKSWLNYWKWTPAVAALLVVAFVYNPTSEQKLATMEVDQLSFKGSTSVGLRLQAEKMNADGVVFAKAGDVLNLEYRGSRSHVLVLYRDDAGSWDTYWGGQNSIELKAQSKWMVHSSEVILDSNWTHEELVVLWSDKEFSLNDAIISLAKDQMDSRIKLKRYFMERR